MKKLQADLLLKQGELEAAGDVWSGLVAELDGLNIMFGEKESLIVSSVLFS